MQSKAKTVDEYIAQLPQNRRGAIQKVRTTILKNLPKGYQEGMQFGMIGYYIPLSRYPETYNGQALGVAGLANQKNYMAVYLMAVYGNSKIEKWFTDEYARSGKKLDMGKCCVRFKTLDDLPLDLIGKVVSKVTPEEYIKLYEASRKKS